MSLLSCLECKNVDIVIENQKTRKHSLRWPLFGLLAVAFFAIGLFIAWNLDAEAAVNTEINYQGKLTDINGVNVTDGKYDFRVRIYDAASSGTAQTISGANTFIDINDVQVQNGIFNLKFSPLASGLTYGSGDRYLLVCFNTSSISLATPDDGYTGANDATGDCDVSGANDVHDKGFTPRKKLTSTPFARLSKYLGSSNVEGGDKTGVYVTNIAPQTGTGTISYANTTVTGVGTLFTQELKVGDTITSYNTGTSTYNIRVVIAIASDTSLTTNQFAFQSSAAFTYQPSGYVMTTSNNLPYFVVNPDGVMIGASTTLPTTSTTSIFTGDAKLGIYNETRLTDVQATNAGIKIYNTLNGVNGRNVGVYTSGSFTDTGSIVQGFAAAYTLGGGSNITTFNSFSSTVNMTSTGTVNSFYGTNFGGSASGTASVTTYIAHSTNYAFGTGTTLAGDLTSYKGSYTFDSGSVLNAGTDIKGIDITVTNNSASTITSNYGLSYNSTNSGTITGSYRGNNISLTNAGTVSTGYFGSNTSITNSGTASALTGNYLAVTNNSGSTISTDLNGFYTDTFNQSATTVATSYGVRINTGVQASGVTTLAYGLYAESGVGSSCSSCSVANAFGGYFLADGTATNVGFRSDVSSRDITGSAYGLVTFNGATNTTTNAVNKFGLYVSSTGTYTGGGGTATNNWGFYVDTVSGADNNYGGYIAGNLGLGNAAPSQKLDVTAGNTQIRFGSTTSDNGGYLISTADNQAILIGGGSYNGTNWIAKATTSSQIQMTGGGFQWYANTGLTIGNSFTPTNVMSLSGSSILIQVPMDLNGTVQVNLENAASTIALCHSVNGQGAVNTNLRDCTGAPVQDYMEFYSVEPGIGVGDVLEISSTLITTTTGEVQPKLKKSTGNNSILFGIASNKDNAGDFNSIGYVIKDSDNPYPVALNGRVPVKIDPSTSPIKAGDYLTASNVVPGRAVKAIGESYVIGKAMEDYSGQDMIFVFVTNTYYNPGNVPTSTMLASNEWSDISGKLTTNKNVQINGNLSVSGNVTINGILTAYNATIRNLTVDKLNVNPNPSVGDSSIGEAKLIAGQISITVLNTNVNQNSKIFLTPKTLTDKVLAVTSIIDGQSFTVTVPNSSLTDIDFDYWIVSTN